MSGQSSNGSTLAVRFEIHAGREVAVPGIKWIRGKENLGDCQRAYIEARDKAGLGHSQFGSADVFTDSGHHIAHISYNGRVWSPESCASNRTLLAEVPQPKYQIFDSMDRPVSCRADCQTHLYEQWQKLQEEAEEERSRLTYAIGKILPNGDVTFEF